MASVPADQLEAYNERLGHVYISKKRRKNVEQMWAPGLASQALVEASGKALCLHRIPGSIGRMSAHEGPQVRLKLCVWFGRTLEEYGATDDVRRMLVACIAETWRVPCYEIEKILARRTLWAQRCEVRGVSCSGLLRDEAQLPRYLRKSRRSKGAVMRAAGGGRKDKLKFLYPIVKDFFEMVRLHGKYIDTNGLEDC